MSHCFAESALFEDDESGRTLIAAGVFLQPDLLGSRSCESYEQHILVAALTMYLLFLMCMDSTVTVS